jgi:nicotinate-nucleotide pyrophosphorylase (carboxylating)
MTQPSSFADSFVQHFALPRIVIEQAVRAALVEDLGAGDVTTAACIPESQRSKATGYAKTKLVVAGLEVARTAFMAIDASVTFTALASDGQLVEPRTSIFEVTGASRSLLMAERVALNFSQRMSGIATLTRSYVDAVVASSNGTRTRITDTRKTTPGLRIFERYAVRMGGGYNHRDNLGSAVLIKDNHIVAAGGVRAAITAARNLAPHTSKIECEVKTMDELAEALEARADIIMLDNMNNAEVEVALRTIAGRALVEVSGGITRERIAALSALGVDVISVGALTHSAPAADISLDFQVTSKT